jgi:cyclase
MNRRNFIQSGASLGLLSLAYPSLAKLFAGQQPAYKVTMLRNNVGVFTERGGTIGFLNTKKGLAVIDSQFPDQAKHLIEELRKLNEKPFEYLFNTHHHGDHTSGNIAFKGLVGHVVAHENSLANQQKTAVAQKSEDKQLYPDVTFGADGWKTKVGGEKIKTHYFGAGHTNGDSIIHFENANIAHVGDLMFNRRFPFVDKANGANIGNWAQVLEKITNTFDNDTLFIFGHALDPEKITGNKEDLKAFKNYLEKLLAYVSAEMKAGKTKEEILKTTIIAGAEDWKGDGIQRSLTAAWQELGGA